MYSLSFLLSYLFLLIVLTKAGIPAADLLKKQQETKTQELYNSMDKVIVVTNSTFNSMVLHQNHSILMEFYNTYCGHCRRFAPKYKKLAIDSLPWYNVLRVCAIDCAVEDNNDICREYEVMAYPTLRYFGPGSVEGFYGQKIETQKPVEIREQLIKFLVAENRTENMTTWPNFQVVAEPNTETLFKGLNSQLQYVVVVYEPDSTTVGVETILEFSRWPIQIRRIKDLKSDTRFQIDGIDTRIVAINRRGAIEPLITNADTLPAYTEAIRNFLNMENLTEQPIPGKEEEFATPAADLTEEEIKKHKELIAEVQRNKHMVYQADLEMAIRGILFNEIPKAANVSGEKLLALQRFLNVLQRYNPLGPHGRSLVTKIYEFVMQYNEKLLGKDFENELRQLKTQLSPIFSANHFVGCAGSKPLVRGFTCSVWQLFHFMSVQALLKPHSQDPLEVLQAMHGYIKYFFGCSDCSEHFQAMAIRQNIWSTPTKEEAVLWLWAAHNEVNQRLAGDSTEDPQFPKIQFPSPSSCTQCYREPISSPANLDINWDKDAVLSFLRNIHNGEYISRYGVDNEDVLQPSVEKMRSKRMISNVFSDIDMRMGMLLYAFCIVMMVIAFKLFAFKGYRKKTYCHDSLGKV